MSHVSQREREKGRETGMLQCSYKAVTGCLRLCLCVCVYETDSQIKGLKGSD